VALRVKWLCYKRSDGEETVLSALSRIYLQVEKLKLKYQAPGTVTWDGHYKAMCYGPTRLRMSDWRALIADLCY
jgi:hypothetical protein